MLAILVKNDDLHPYSRINVDVKKITGSAMHDYINSMLDDIDKANDSTRDYVYSKFAHATSVEINEWIEPFVKELTRFIILNLLKYGNIGQALRHYTMALDQMNYWLVRAQTTQEFLNPFSNDKYENISIDNVVVSIIKSEISNAKTCMIEKEDLNELLAMRQTNNITTHENNIDTHSIDEQRELYNHLLFTLKNTYRKYDTDNNAYACERKRNARKNWKPIDQKLAEETFDSLEIYKKYYQAELEECKEKIKYAENVLNTIDQTGTLPKHLAFFEEHPNILNLCNENFQNFCHEIDITNKELYDIVDNFIGQALRQLLK